MIDINNLIHKIYIMRDLKRYNNAFRIKDESVAEHSYFVAMSVLLLNQIYNFDLNKAIQMALVHDCGEPFITDVPHDVKERFVELRNVLEDSEKIAIKEEYPREIFDLFCEFEIGNTLEALVVELADVISCIQFSSSEVNLGNGYMKRVLVESVIRKEELELKLLKHKKIKEGQTKIEEFGDEE